MEGLTAGIDLGGKLVLEREIGRGAMGCVWVARHLALGHRVAVKFLQGAALHSEARERFEREARAIARVQNPHVVHISDFGVTPAGAPYIVMELLQGEDLQRRIDRSGPLSLHEVSTILAQVCEGLAGAHRWGIVHRDVKPANVFLLAGTTGTFVKLLDFGIAKVEGERALAATSGDGLVGTPYFMSPEQLVNAGQIDHRADLWSTAVLAYVALTGRLPFEARGLGELVGAVSAGRFVPPSRHRGDLPPSLDAWFSRALCPDPRGRFASAQELASSFAHALTTDPALLATAHAPPGATPAITDRPQHALHGMPHASLAGLAQGTSASPPAQRRSAVPWIAGVALVALLGLGAIAAIGWRDAGSSARADAEAMADEEDEGEREEGEDGSSRKRPRKGDRPSTSRSPRDDSSSARPGAPASTSDSTHAPAATPAPGVPSSKSGSVAGSSSGQSPPSALPGIEPTAAAPTTPAPTATPPATTSAAPSAPATSAPCTCPSWRPRNETCRKFPASGTCGACCKPGDRQEAYPSCACMLDACKLPNSPCR